MKVVVVGSGPWSAKLERMIGHVTKLKVTNFSAREMFRESVDGDIFWLATTPINQLRILPNIANNAKVIVEKPTFLNSLELEMVYREYMEREGRLYFSLPWNYSTSMELLLENLDFKTKTNVRVKRGGPLQRSYIPSYMDWLPHDLGMISRLPESTNLEFDSVVLEGESIRILAHLSNVEFNLHIGLMENRVAEWEILTQSQDSYSLDLNNQVKNSGEEPLGKMFLDYLSNLSQSEGLFQVWRKFFRTASLG